MKEYFSHDANARCDEKCVALLMAHRLEGYGLFWCIIERLMQESGHTLAVDYNVIAYDMRCSSELVKSVIEDFGLFSFTEDGKRFYSESLMRRTQKFDEVSAKRKEAAQRRWSVENANAQEIGCKCNANAQKNDANAMQMHENLDAEKSRVKKSRVKNPPLPPSGGGADVFDERFELFWQAYPKKTGTGAAKTSFRKIKPSQELTERMIRAVELAKQSEQWQRDNGQYIPYPATWLNQRRWEDEPMPKGKPKPDKSQGCVPQHEADAEKFNAWNKEKRF